MSGEGVYRSRTSTSEPLISGQPAGTGERQRAGPWTQLWVLLWKNWQLKRRHPVGFLFELGLPVGFFGLLVVLHGVVGKHESHQINSGLLDTAGNFSQTSFLAFYAPVPAGQWPLPNGPRVTALQPAEASRIVLAPSRPELLPAAQALCRCIYITVVAELAQTVAPGLAPSLDQLSCASVSQDQFDSLVRKFGALLPASVPASYKHSLGQLCDAGASSAVFASEDAMWKHIKQVAGRNCIKYAGVTLGCQYAGVVLDSDGSKQTGLQITIRMNSSSLAGAGQASLSTPCGTTLPSTKFLRRPFSTGIRHDWKSYVCAGFTALQSIGADFAYQNAGGHGRRASSFSYKAFPAPGFTEDSFLEQVLKAQFTQFLVLAFFVLAVGQVHPGVGLGCLLGLGPALQGRGARERTQTPGRAAHDGSPVLEG